MKQLIFGDTLLGFKKVILCLNTGICMLVYCLNVEIIFFVYIIHILGICGGT